MRFAREFIYISRDLRIFVCRGVKSPAKTDTIARLAKKRARDVGESYFTFSARDNRPA